MAIIVIVFLCSIAVFLPNNNVQTFEYNPISGPITNPLMGFAPWSDIKESAQPHTLVYADLSWREFEPREGFFDFESFESQNHLDRWKTEGKRVVFRFVLDFPGGEEHIDIPDWLYAKINGDGDLYDHGYGKGFSPNYSNPTIIEYHKKAITALGEHYGGNDFFAYIELGSLGHWGEWHVKYESGIRRMPPEDIRDIYVNHYIEAFPNTQLLMRRPFSIAEKLDLGLYNDMTGDFDATLKWLHWIENGGEFTQTDEKNALSAMPNGWQLAPVGGEQTGSLSEEDIYDTYLDYTIRLLENSHTTFLGPGGPYNLENGGQFQKGVDKVLATIGYRLYIKRSEMPRWIIFDDHIQISLHFGNDGIAPIYYDWPVRIYILDKDGKHLGDYPVDLDLRKILPGSTHKINFSIPIEKYDQGKYSLGVAIIDPLTDLPAVQLAMDSNRQDMIQELGEFYIIRWGERIISILGR
ncbi:MAG: DUF4832 domain-containing protein [Chloroflexi bacterium]|nr:DUF4832 domain-containing protein [Chloroflexota bacterium]